MPCVDSATLEPLGKYFNSICMLKTRIQAAVTAKCYSGKHLQTTGNAANGLKTFTYAMTQKFV